jgi:hypothetical protein
MTTSLLSDVYPTKGTSAERKVRQVGAKIGLKGDSEILNQVCLKMRQELVFKVWQLPALDSFQLKSLDAPIGLAAAVRGLAFNIDIEEGPFRGEDKEEEKVDVDVDIVPIRSQSKEKEQEPVVENFVGVNEILREINDTDAEKEVGTDKSNTLVPVSTEDKEPEDAGPLAVVRSTGNQTDYSHAEEDMMKLEIIGEFQSIIFEDNAEADEAPNHPSELQINLLPARNLRPFAEWKQSFMLHHLIRPLER